MPSSRGHRPSTPPGPARPGGGAQRERGAVLLIAIAILALLSLFATAFARLVSFERRASSNYTDGVRARLLAKAGVKHAMAELKMIAAKQHYSEPGDRWTYGYVPPLSEAQMTARDLRLNLLTTQTPSFATNVSGIEGVGALRMFGQPLAVSGVLGATYQNGADVYKLKVIDGSAQLNLNHPDKASLKRMLKNLLKACSELEGPSNWPMTSADAEAIATYVVDNRPSVGFRSKAEIEQLITSLSIVVSDPESRLRIEPPLAPKSIDRWNDAYQTSVKSSPPPLLPVPLTSGPLKSLLPSIKPIKKLSSQIFARPAVRDLVTVYSWVDEKVIRPWDLNGDGQRGLPLMPRAPVNLNTAPKPVLVATLAEIKARNGYGTFHLGYAGAVQLADAIIKRRGEIGPFKSWPEFEQWLYGKDPLDTAGTYLPPASIFAVSRRAAENDAVSYWIPNVRTPSNPGGLVPDNTSLAYSGWIEDASPTWVALINGHALRDLVKAALNPNTMINKFGLGTNHGGSLVNGKVPVPRLVDKADLVNLATEGCFDSMGVFEVTSLGMILQQDPDDANESQVISTHNEQVVVRVYDVLRLTTQSDFEQYRAMFVDGDFIPDFHHWDDLLGYNRPRYKEFSGWPGMITHPVYSLERDGTKVHDIVDRYTPAQYDGYLSLSNLLGSYLWKSDFAVGFARGGTEAFKARAWWEPKDQDPFVDTLNGKPIKSKQPTRPAKAYPERNLGGAVIGTSQTEKTWYDKSDGSSREGVAPWPEAPDFSDLRQLVQPRSPYGVDDAGDREPFTEGRVSGLADPLDALLGATATDPRFWQEGSSLWNNGVATGSRRNLFGPGADPTSAASTIPTASRPAVLAYDSDNLQLTPGCSIRFWVQPTVDPFLYPEEVLFSFIGSWGHDPVNQGNRREVGFRVIKKVRGASGVSIILQAAPGGPKWTGQNGVNPGGKSSDSDSAEFSGARWHTVDGKAGIWRDQVTVDVSSFMLQLGTSAASKTASKKKQSPFAVSPLDPFNPNWLANTWHWVVINYGFTGRSKGTSAEKSTVTLPEMDMSLQVDLSPTQPPKGIEVSDANTGRIAFLGEMALSPGYGELHGYDTTRNVGHGDPVKDMWLGYWTGGNASTRTGFQDPNMAPKSLNKTAYLHYDADTYAVLWTRQRTLGDFYHCDLPRDGSDGTGSFTATRYTAPSVEDAVFYNGSDYVLRDPSILKSFPKNSFGWTVYLEFHDKADGSIVSGGNIPANGQVRLGYDPGNDGGYSNWSSSFSGLRCGPDEVAGGEDDEDEWRIDVILEWTKYEKLEGCECCRDGAAKEKWDAKAAGENPFPNYLDGEPFPNGCYHDSASMYLHGWKPNVDPSTIDPAVPGSGARCWMVFKAGEHGHLGASGFADAPETLHADAVCDDCHGCEGCDVDGPMFLGGEPAADLNYSDLGSKRLAAANPATVAHAVFDNFVVKNTYTRRTDYLPPSGHETPDWFEDRFFTTNMAADYIEGSGRSTNEDGEFVDLGATIPAEVDTSDRRDRGYGAVYRRGLLELKGVRGRLGSMTWTTYPTSDEALHYEVKLYKLPGENQSAGDLGPWRSDNRGMIDENSPTWTAEWAASKADVGIGFGDDPNALYMGRVHGPAGAVFGPEILVLGVQLADFLDSSGVKERYEFESTVDAGDKPVTIIKNKATALPTPVYETPVFEDVTLNVIRESAEVLYAEEGVTE